ncbi:aminoacyl-tRNA hydrolase [Patescibacteria group bacterium]|nr:aminoacyl-tRNA hydrolase [Patescibacteria group bacterium]MBU1246555.1 aminoacyl-tRNA hydrolase [Patescibacteria group bacterium]MBU1519725.1 aminoacyl-tRNA hydrolase [Patescibacteria group bacterium]MBU1730427.1 aminoacyl-tRNA hydrolase [Patescibacteria group bacterium]MBU1956492.1 aminoacyl-tRNA hydrolase [Patescibacteria group bacterium]
MTYIIVGLGNPGEDYVDTPHNTGRIVLECFMQEKSFSDWEKKKELKANVSKGKIEKKSVTLVEPDNYMNNSGKSLVKLIKNKKQAEQLVIIYDDIDLPLGTLKISFNRGSGGHKGVESIVKSIKTRAFIRIRVGIAPTTPAGVIKKPKGEDAVGDYILKKFSKKHREQLDQAILRAVSAVETIICHGKEQAMTDWN